MYVIDPVTLRERITDQAAFDHELGQLRAAQARGADVRAQLVPMLRIAGFLDDAERMGRDYLGQLDSDISPARAHAARLRLAQVLQYQGRFAEARQLFDVVIAATTGSLQAFAYQHRGTCLVEEGQATGSLELLTAGLADLETALRMRREMGSDAALMGSSTLAVNRARELVFEASRA